MASGTRRAALWGALSKARDGVLSIAADVIETVGDVDDSDSDSAAGSDDSTGSRFLADYDEDEGGVAADGAGEELEPSPPSPATVLLASAARVSVSRREAQATPGEGCVAGEA